MGRHQEYKSNVASRVISGSPRYQPRGHLREQQQVMKRGQQIGNEALRDHLRGRPEERVNQNSSFLNKG